MGNTIMDKNRWGEIIISSLSSPSQCRRRFPPLKGRSETPKDSTMQRLSPPIVAHGTNSQSPLSVAQGSRIHMHHPGHIPCRKPTGNHLVSMDAEFHLPTPAPKELLLAQLLARQITILAIKKASTVPWGKNMLGSPDVGIDVAMDRNANDSYTTISREKISSGAGFPWFF